MTSTVSVDPFRCRLWTMHGRLEEYITEENCAEEVESFKQHGQLLPALGRLVRDDPDCDIEVICGARRLFAARYLKVKLLVEVRELSDREAIIAMDLENRQRKDLSPYERGVSYARLIRSGYFASQEEIALAMNISPSRVSRLLKLARLPSAIIGAFNAALDIRESWAVTLAEALEDPIRRQSAMRVAREIRAAAPRPAAREVYRRLLGSATRGHKPRNTSHDKVVKGNDGTPLFRIRHQTGSIALLLPAEMISAKSLDAIERALLHILQPVPEDRQPADVASRGRRSYPTELGVAPRDAETNTKLSAPPA